MSEPMAPSDAAVGLTGGIACGKSTLAEAMRRRGWRVIDTDEIARAQLAAGTEVSKKVVDVFGPKVLSPNKSIDRKVLGQLVFSDPALRAQLNEITHPAIRRVWQQERIEQARTHPSEFLAVMIPLLYECDLQPSFTRIWAVGASAAAQARRLAARGLSPQEAQQRLASQLPVPEKMARADLAFWGEGPPGALERQLDFISSS